MSRWSSRWRRLRSVVVARPEARSGAGARVPITDCPTPLARPPRHPIVCFRTPAARLSSGSDRAACHPRDRRAGRLRARLGGDSVIDPLLQPPDSFYCERGRDASTAWVRPVGELDLDTAPLLEEALTAARAQGGARLVLDLRRLTFMDSTGLRLVIRWDTAAREEGFEFAIVP